MPTAVIQEEPSNVIKEESGAKIIAPEGDGFQGLLDQDNNEGAAQIIDTKAEA